jgi:hypothetical protein|nr:MAG TPA: hypothetical protein [Caudoviricetes sp.]
MKAEYIKVTIEGETYKVKSNHQWAAFDGDSCLWSFATCPSYNDNLNFWISDDGDFDLLSFSTCRFSGLYKIIEQPDGSYEGQLERRF